MRKPAPLLALRVISGRETIPAFRETIPPLEKARFRVWFREAAMSSRPDVYTVELTEAQLLHAWFQSQNTLAQTCKDIKRGRCVDADAT